MTVAMDGEVGDGPGEVCRSGGGEEAEVEEEEGEEREGAPGVTTEQARLGGGVICRRWGSRRGSSHRTFFLTSMPPNLREREREENLLGETWAKSSITPPFPSQI